MKGKVFMHSCYISALCLGAVELGWGETLENGHLNQQPVVAGLLVVK